MVEHPFAVMPLKFAENGEYPKQMFGELKKDRKLVKLFLGKE
jgi:hypothetical protein